MNPGTPERSGNAERDSRDPRVGMTREPGGSASGGVDTATRVISTRDLTTEATTDPDPTPDDDAPARKAVAGWVRPSPDPQTNDADANADANGNDADASDDAPDAEAPSSTPDAGDPQRTTTPATGTAEGAGKPEAGNAGTADAGQGAGAADADPDTDPDTDPDADPELDPDADPESRSGAEPGTGVAPKADGGPEAAEGAADEQAKAPEPAKGTGSATAVTAPIDPSAPADSEEAPAKSAASGGKGGATPTAAAVPAVDQETGEETGEEAPAKSAASGAGADAEGDAAEKADGAEEAPEGAVVPGGGEGAPDAPEDPSGPAGGDEAPKGAAPTGDPDGTGTGTGKGEDGDAGAEQLDQPTAVFKAPAPKPEVDQPTTMLKLGGDPERTSRFVALKPLDEPKAPRAGDVTALVPQVGPERTTQTPLPPKPPLDLLAELTNTPPPPQTPVRILVRRVKIWTPLVLLLILIVAIAQAFRPLPSPTLALTAEDSYTFDGSKATLPWPSEGQGSLDVEGIGTMDAFGTATPVAIGSVAKAMTAYIVLKDHPLKSGQDGAKVPVDALAEKEGGYSKDGESTLDTVKEGDVLTERQALSAIMIPSANNIARLLARWDAGSEAAFIKKMNDTAKELGMTGTTYTDASGLKETTVSTAADQVKLGNELVKIPALMEITKLPTWKDPSGKEWTNYNRLVPYNGALGIKTGTTTKAGGNLLFAATKEVGGETVTVVGAILGQHTAPIIDTVNAVSKTAMVAAQDALKSAKILKKGDVVGYVDDQLGGHTPIVASKDVSAVGWSGLKVKLSFDADDIPHTAKAGTRVGTLTVGDGDGGAVKVPVQLQSDLTEPALGAKLTRLL
ncbi:D-alanyl-D-alanine carboxypeptidase [Streptomyces sp. NPDC087294]|uniref:D-alanyl-D-alanine carboxypeptidase n=1 Tax=Streptomyces sp. NPDC087294 TaxID=3365777 RepID=UPI0037F688D7